MATLLGRNSASAALTATFAAPRTTTTRAPAAVPSTLSRLVAKATAPSTASAPVPTRGGVASASPLAKFVGTSAAATALSTGFAPSGVAPPPVFGTRNPYGPNTSSIFTRIANSLSSSPTASPTGATALLPSTPAAALAPVVPGAPTADSGAPLSLPGSPTQPAPYSGGGGGGGGGGGYGSGSDGGYDDGSGADDGQQYDANGNPIAPLPPAVPGMTTEKKLLIGAGVLVALGGVYLAGKHRS